MDVVITPPKTTTREVKVFFTDAEVVEALMQYAINSLGRPVPEPTNNEYYDLYYPQYRTPTVNCPKSLMLKICKRG